MSELVCPHCGKVIAEHVSYRALRGRGQDVAATSFDPLLSDDIFCAVCGATNDPRRPFCYQCGSFRGNQEAEPPSREVLRARLRQAVWGIVENGEA